MSEAIQHYLNEHALLKGSLPGNELPWLAESREQALSQFNELGFPHHRLEDWNNLAEILPRLKKHGRIDQDTIDRWTTRVYIANLRRASSGDAVIAEWGSIAKKFKSDESLLKAYYEALMRTDKHQKAEKDLIAALKQDWRATLVKLYGLVEGPDPSKQLQRAEGWLTERPDDADLLLTTARLCLRNELWGKARSYLETVLAVRPTPEAFDRYIGTYEGFPWTGEWQVIPWDGSLAVIYLPVDDPMDVLRPLRHVGPDEFRTVDADGALGMRVSV